MQLITPPVLGADDRVQGRAVRCQTAGSDLFIVQQVVCIPENDACGVDALQIMLRCSIGKGNLLFHLAGKQAFSFYNRGTGRSVRLEQSGKHDAYEKVMAAVADFEKGNIRLSDVLKELEVNYSRRT